MKRIKFLKSVSTVLIMMITAVFFTACSDGGDFDDNESFTIDRDKTFEPKAINDTVEFKYNVKPNYSFEKIPMKFKYTSSLSGTLVLNKQVLAQNVEYDLTNQNNTFKYVGKAQGGHVVTIIATNEKNQTTTEEFNFQYSTADFDVNITGGSNNLYQGQSANYNLTITPKAAYDTGGYQIKFTSYDNNASSSISLAGKKIDLNKYYDLTAAQIGGVAIQTIAYTAGNLTLNYTIKNNGGQERSNYISQAVQKNQITFTSLSNGNKTIYNPGEIISLNAIITKTPNISNKIWYKTWISEDNNQALLNEIPTTNGSYVAATLDGTSFKFPNITTLTNLADPYGTCKLNVQVKDEFGNESEIKSFPIQIGAPLGFDASPIPAIKLVFNRSTTGTIGTIAMNYYKGFYRTFVARCSLSPFNNVTYEVKFTMNGKEYTYTHNDTSVLNKNYIEYWSDRLNTNISLTNTSNNAITNAKVTVTLIDKVNGTVSKTITPTIQWE